MFEALWTPIWVAIVAVIAALAVLTGCSSCPFVHEVEGTAVPEPTRTATTDDRVPPPEVPVLEGQEDKPAAFQVMRLIDPCALHSPEGAERISGLIPDDLMPGHTRNKCRLNLVRTANELPSWTLTTTVGVDFGEAGRSRSQRQDVDGQDFWMVPPSKWDKPGEECTYVKELGAEYALELHATKQDERAKGDPCQLARDYLLAVSKWWKNPALRADKITAPHLPIATADPCEAVAAAGKDVAEPAVLLLLDPHSCVLQPKDYRPGVSSLLSLEYKTESDPRAILDKGPSEYSAITVAGKPGTKAQLPGIDGPNATLCFVTVIADEQVTLQADQTRADALRSYQVIAARSPDCALATKAAVTALK
jgi:hypothetical protein